MQLFRSENKATRGELAQKIERETERVISEHLPTIFATREASHGQREPIPPAEVERHIRNYFAEFDAAVEKTASDLRSNPLAVDQFKLFFRQLYRVAPIESHIRAIEAGKQEALRLAGGEEKNVRLWEVGSSSGELFRRSANLLAKEEPTDSDPAKAVYLADDVSHSGSQLAASVSTIRKSHPDAPIVVSVGVITQRARERLREKLDPARDSLLYQEEMLDLAQLFEAVPDKKIRKQLAVLAYAFFKRHGRYDFERMLESTHIITPFKLPDAFSNGPLECLVYGDRLSWFAPQSAPFDSQREKIYPAAL